MGRLLGSKYLLLRSLGEGGAGCVYVAAQLPLGQLTAVKVLHGRDDALSSPARLRREALALAALRHPNVVRLIDYATEGERVWLVMEYIEQAATLGELMAEGVSVDSACRLLDGISRGLDAAHGAGLVHRDVKPDNVLLQSVPGQEPIPRLVDFGLVKFIDDATTSNLAAGTLRYMAPEQAMGGEVGPPSDWYAVGVIACQLLLGTHPFAQGSPISAVRAKCSPLFDPVKAMGRPLGPRSEAFVRRVLARRPEDRAASLREVLDGVAAMAAEVRAGDVRERLSAEPEATVRDHREVGERAGSTGELRPPPDGPSRPRSIQVDGETPREPWPGQTARVGSSLRWTALVAIIAAVSTLAGLHGPRDEARVTGSEGAAPLVTPRVIDEVSHGPVGAAETDDIVAFTADEVSAFAPPERVTPPEPTGSTTEPAADDRRPIVRQAAPLRSSSGERRASAPAVSEPEPPQRTPKPGRADEPAASDRERGREAAPRPDPAESFLHPGPPRLAR